MGAGGHAAGRASAPERSARRAAPLRLYAVPDVPRPFAVALQGLFLHFGEGNFLTLRTDGASAAAIAAAVNTRAARRAALRRAAGGADNAGTLQ